MNLFEHGPDCLPLMPCQACQIVAWLRSKLTADDFEELIDRAKVLNNPPPKRSYRRRRQSLPPAAESQTTSPG